MKATIERAVAIESATFTIAPSERSRQAGHTKPYTVTIKDGRAYCDCDGFQFVQKCYHTRRILAAVSELMSVPQPEIPLAERGVLNGRQGWSLLK